MIDVCGRCDTTASLALGAERMFAEPRLSRLVPSSRVAPIPSRWTGRVGCTPSKSTVRATAATLDESGTAGMRAWALGSKWQMTLAKREKPRLRTREGD